MGHWDCFCVLCGGDVVSEWAWSRDLVGFTETGGRVKPLYYDGYGGFRYAGGTLEVARNPHSPDIHGVVAHTDCWRVLKAEGVAFQFATVAARLSEFDGIVEGLPYPGLQFMGQQYDHEAMRQRKPWLGESPWKNQRHRRALVKLWKHFEVH